MMDQRVQIVEVGPRDGLQNISKFVPTNIKVELIQRLVNSGLSTVEATSFVSPEWIPQLADSKEVLASLRPLLNRTNLRLPVLVPNLKGLEMSLQHGVREVAVFVSASEGFSRKNTNCSVQEGLQRAREVATEAKKRNIAVRGYVSCIFACPYDGPTPPPSVLEVTRELLEMGCYQVSLGDTLGVGTPADVERLLSILRKSVSLVQLAGHFHDTYGQAVANVVKAYELGIRVFDSSISGLGGCPYAEGATGNAATEDIAYTFERFGVPTGINMRQLVETGQWISEKLGRTDASRAGTALFSKFNKFNISQEKIPENPSLTWKRVHSSDEFSITQQGSNVKLTLLRPKNGNTLTASIVTGLTSAIKSLSSKASEIHRIIITGTGKYFCTGMDLGKGSSISDNSKGRKMPDDQFSGLSGLFEAISNAPQVTIALINGPCFGGGIGLAFVCDIRLAISTATFTLSEVRLGLAPAVISRYVTREWGVSFTRAAMLTGRPVSSAELHRIGAILEVHPDIESLQVGLQRLLKYMLANAPSASTLCKSLVQVAWEDPNGSRQRQTIEATFDKMMASDESKYGLMKFREGVRTIDWVEYNAKQLAKL